MNTRTGCRSLAAPAGVQTFRYRQSSATAPCAMNSYVHGFRASTMFWTQFAANASAFLTPSHRDGGCGARHRRSPTGGAANGTPLNTLTAASPAGEPASCPSDTRTDVRARAASSGIIATAHTPRLASHIFMPDMVIASGNRCLYSVEDDQRFVRDLTILLAAFTKEHGLGEVLPAPI